MWTHVHAHIPALHCCWLWSDLPPCFCSMFDSVASCSLTLIHSRDYHWKITILADLWKRRNLNMVQNEWVMRILHLKCHMLNFKLYLQRWSKCFSRSCTAVPGLSNWFPCLKKKKKVSKYAIICTQDAKLLVTVQWQCREIIPSCLCSCLGQCDRINTTLPC